MLVKKRYQAIFQRDKLGRTQMYISILMDRRHIVESHATGRVHKVVFTSFSSVFTGDEYFSYFSPIKILQI